MLYSNFLSFYCSFSVSGSHGEYLITFSRHVSLGFFRLWQSPRLWWLWWFWEIPALGRRTSLNCDFPVFLMIKPKLWVWVRKTTEANCRSRYAISRVYTISTGPITVDLEVVLVRFLHYKVIFTPFCTYFLDGSHYAVWVAFQSVDLIFPMGQKISIQTFPYRIK